MTSKEVQRLQLVVGDLEARLTEARVRLHKQICSEYPYQPGSLIRGGGHRILFVARINRLEVHYGNVTPIVNKRLKSGEFSDYPTRLSSYERIEPFTEDTQ